MTSIIYEVNIAVDADRLREYLAWLKPHMAQMKALPGFQSAELFVRDLSDEAPRHSPDPTRAHVTALYRLDSMASLDNYMDNHAEAMRADGTQRFGGCFSAWRRVLTSVASDAELAALDASSIPHPSATPSATPAPARKAEQVPEKAAAPAAAAKPAVETSTAAAKKTGADAGGEEKKQKTEKKKEEEESKKKKGDNKEAKTTTTEGGDAAGEEDDEDAVDQAGVPLKDKAAAAWVKEKLQAEVRRFRSTPAAAQWRLRPLAVKNTGIVRESRKRTLNRVEMDVPLDFRAVGEILVSPSEPVPAKPGFSATFVILVPKEEELGASLGPGSWPERTMGILPYIYKTDKKNSLAHWAFLNSEGVRTRLEVRGAATIEEDADDDEDDEDEDGGDGAGNDDGKEEEEAPTLVK